VNRWEEPRAVLEREGWPSTLLLILLLLCLAAAMAVGMAG